MEVAETKSYPYQSASSGIEVAYRIVMGAAAVVVITAGCRLKGAASPSKAVITILVDAAASASLRAWIIIITNSWGFYRRRWWRWIRLRRVLTLLGWIWWLYGNSTLARFGAGDIALQPDVSILTPAGSPWVPHNPVINTVFGTIPNSNHTVV